MERERERERERVDREKESYDCGDVFEESCKLQARFHHVFTCPNTQRCEQYFNAILEESAKGKSLLDYGCGNGGMTERYSKLGANSITGIDISETGIQEAIKKHGDLSALSSGRCPQCAVSR